ncbi:MAG: DUF3108 domain-containing protein [Epsilonproteobacteria bacterium]|nr:DUF3108 domain-containing protein [Campylobacterota bacterium]
MHKVILFLLLSLSTLYAQNYTIDATYKIYYGFFGSIGKASATLHVEDNTYKIRLKAEATGLAKIMSRDRVESYESTGYVDQGKLVPQIFISSKQRASKTDIKRYFFNHQDKSIDVRTTRIRGDVRKEMKTTLPFFTTEDLLTLFFNLRYHLGSDYTIKENRRLVAAGASDKDGRIDIRMLGNKEYQEISTLLKESDHILGVVLNQRIFASPKGEMFVNVNDEGICTAAILKDVVMFGDIRGELKKIKSTK